MSSLVTKIKLYAEANSKVADFDPFTGNVEVSDLLDGKGLFISRWKIDGLDKPTDEQLNALNTQADTLEKNQTALANRKAEYGSWEEQLDYIYHNGITKWKTDHIKPIKDKYPKE